MADKTPTAELLELEKKFWQAIQDKDHDTAIALSEDPCIVAGAQGVERLDRQSFAAMLDSDVWSLKGFELKDEQVLFPSADVALVAYKVREELIVEGKPLTLEAAQASTWIRRDGQWRCALHTESLLGDPFGRDRIVKGPVAGVLADQEAIANLPVKDLGAARKFYEDTVGLTPVETEGEELVVYRSGTSTLNVYRSDYAGTNRATAVTWVVGDVDGTVQELKSKGVTFEHYDLPEMKRQGDVHLASGMKVAWFKDPDGNILNIASR